MNIVENELRAENEELHRELREYKSKKKWHLLVLQAMHDQNTARCVGTVHEVLGRASCSRQSCTWIRRSSGAITACELANHVLGIA